MEKKIIYIADDEESIRILLKQYLEKEGYETYAFADGEATLKAFKEKACDMIIMDIRMPNLNGIDALRIMKRLNRKVPVILFTGQAGKGDMYEATRLGAYTCLLKPVSPEKLIYLLDQSLNINA